LSALGRPPSISVFLFAHLPPCSAIYLLSLHDALPIFLRVMASILSMVEFAKDAIAFGNPCFSELPADRVQVRMAEKIGIAIAAGLPDRPVPGGDGEVGAGETRSEEHSSELQSRFDLVCRLLLEKKKA